MDDWEDSLMAGEGNALALWIACGTWLTAGQEEIISCRIKNTSADPLTLLEIAGHFWQQCSLQRRQICHELKPGEESALGLPFFAELPGRYLLTSMKVTAAFASGQIATWQTKDEVAFQAISPQSKTLNVYQIHLKDYAQVFGDIRLNAEAQQWQRLLLVRTASPESDTALGKGEEVSGLDYCGLKITTPVGPAYYYLSSRAETYLGRSSSAEFQTLGKYSPDDPKNLQISARQAKIYYKRSQWYIEDCGSRNGTRVNGMAIRPYTASPLCEGDRINLADVVALTVNINTKVPLLKLNCGETLHSDVYMILFGRASMGKSQDCAVRLLDCGLQKIAYLDYCGGYTLQGLCEFTCNGRKFKAGSTVPLRVGDELCIAEIGIHVEEGN